MKMSDMHKLIQNAMVPSGARRVPDDKAAQQAEKPLIFTMSESFLRAYLKYIEALKIESPDKHFALEIAIDPTRKHVVPAIGIIEVNEEKEGNAL